MIAAVEERAVQTWVGCYNDSWQGFITDESFAHPAKAAYGLAERIIKYGLARGYWKVGDVCGDPFCGVGCFGIMAAAHGLRCVGVELEPRFVELAKTNFQLNPWCRNGVCTILQGDSRNFAALVGQCSAICTSPPFAKSEPCQDNNFRINDGRTMPPQGQGGYGSSPGQLSSLPVGDLAAIISSPPYAESITGSHGERETAEDSRDARRTEGGSLGQSQRHGGYGITEGQVGALPVGNIDAICTSPPYEGKAINDHDDQDGYRRIENASGKTFGASIGETYGKSNGQLGNTSGPTYWEAVKAIYEQCLLALKPGGVICVVMGNYVKAGKIVDLCGQTWTLLQHVGFVPLERIKALKTTTTEDAGLFEPMRKTKSRVSFFRRLSIQKGSPDPGGEEILFLEKPA